MTASDLLAAAQAAGLQVSAAADCLVIRGPKSAAAIARQLLDQKAEVMAALAPPPASAPTPPFDPAEADALLAQLDVGLKAVEATYPGSVFPPVRRGAASLIVETCRSYAADRGWWEARNCDPMESLRRAVPFWLRKASEEWVVKPKKIA